MKDAYRAKGLRIIGIHTPEFEFEKDRGRVERAVERFKVDYPVYMDNDYMYWKSLGNLYWPSFYLVDRQGRIRLRMAGQMVQGAARASEMEQMIQTLLAEK